MELSISNTVGYCGLTTFLKILVCDINKNIDRNAQILFFIIFIVSRLFYDIIFVQNFSTEVGEKLR